ncbi:MAG: hypothetical protein OT477_13160 [Chloroflexi bacterium]|nr:hypothetical protein [Chloroflexota bacterium]
MSKRLIVGLLMGLLAAVAAVGSVAAQVVYDGSIRGTVYLDANGDGQCVGTGEATHPGVPIEFVSDDGKWSTYLQTGDNGTYGLVAAAYGTWTVSARPNPNDFVVTSKPTLSVFIGSEQPLALNVNFCIQTKGGPIQNQPTTTYLPTSGVAAQHGGLVVAGLLGLLLIGGGTAVAKRRS